MPHASVAIAIELMELTPSTTTSLPACCATRARACSGFVRPVDVSLCVRSTTLALGCLSSTAAKSSASTGCPHSNSRRTTSAAYAAASAANRSPKLPHRAATTSSPGETRFAIADSSPPVPELVSSRRSLEVLNTRFAPALISARIAANSGPRWSIIGRFMLRTTRSGRGVGPGMRSWVWKVMGALQ